VLKFTHFVRAKINIGGDKATSTKLYLILLVIVANNFTDESFPTAFDDSDFFLIVEFFDTHYTSFQNRLVD